jgi:gamma-glutamylcyclotransferase (GGCT)/AIG2-like uncharacterized protein YtfP/cation transport regulator ChaC
MAEYVFVYGTLRQNEPNHDFMEGAELVSEPASLSGQLWDTRFGYPAVVLYQQSTVYGELYRITAELLQRLDVLEGYYGPEGPNHYERVEQTVFNADKSYSAYIYISPESPAHGVCLKSGDWKVEKRLTQQSLIYFAYGSCMDQVRFQKDDVDHLFKEVLGCGILKNYEMKFTQKASDGWGRADIVETMGSRVEGKLDEVGKKVIDYLFVREGVSGKVYRPNFVTVEHKGTKFPNVLTFTVVDKQIEEISPPKLYLEEILRGANGDGF